MITILCMVFIGGWDIQSTPTNNDLFSVACVSATECWAVGLSGTILHTTDGGQNWIEQTSGTSEDLFGISFVDNMEGWVAGYGPTILHTIDGGTNWTPQTPGTSNDLLDIFFIDGNRGWATGVTGTIMGTTNGGSSWSSEISGQWAWLWGVTAVSPTKAWTTGADWFNNIAPIYVYDGSNWSQQFEITATKDGKALTAGDLDHIWAVGGDGIIYYTTDGGSSWVNQTSNTTSTLWDASATSPSRCWAVGSHGTILVTSDAGSQWTPQTCPVTDSLLGIDMYDDQYGWIATENGTILYTDNGGYGCMETQTTSLNSISLYPNPVTTRMNITIGSPIDGPVRIEIYDVLGRLCTTLYPAVVKGDVRFDVDDLNPGTYVLIIRSEKAYVTRRFVKIAL